MKIPDSNEEYTVVPVIPVDSLLHSEENPFCYNPSCPCHEDITLIDPINQSVLNGELSPQEATDIVRGKKL